MKIILIFLALIIALLLCMYLYNNFFVTNSNIGNNERIVFVTGSYTEPKYLDAWQLYLESQFPSLEVQVFRAYYPYKPMPESTERLIEVRNKLQELLLQNPTKPTRVITYSYGAVLFSAALKEIQNTDQEVNVVRTVTVAGPIADDSAFGDAEFRQSRVEIGYDFENKLPNHTSICGYFDSLVNCTRATYPGEESIKTFSNHYTYVVPQLFAGRTIITELLR